MINTVPLYEEYRNGILECIHMGTVCVVDKNGIVASAGDTDWTCYYRSASKAIQALPVIQRGLDKKYGLTEEEAAIFSGSHWGDEEHVRVLESIMEKTGLKEEQMIMLPTYPGRSARKEELLRQNMPPRKIYHNCSGKHLGMMLLTRELGLPVEDYWIRGTKTQQVILDTISQMTDVPADEIQIGVDGCGVPVYAVPFHRIAVSYLRLVNPQLIRSDALAEAVQRNVALIHKHPDMIAGRDIVDSVLCSDPNTIAKSGAMAVYAMGLAAEGLGIVMKTMDGSHDEFAPGAVTVCRALGCDFPALRRVEELYPQTIINDNREVVGHRKTVIQLQKNTI